VTPFSQSKVNRKADRMQSVSNVMRSVSERDVFDYKTENIDEKPKAALRAS
jgi:hypothetical protein